MGSRTVFWVVIALLLIATMAGVGYYAYSAGVAHGITESLKAGEPRRAELLLPSP